MQVETVFVSINARDFAAQTDWWSQLIGREPDRQPMPSCQEWDLRDGVLFQVLDDPDGQRTAVSLAVRDLPSQVRRLRGQGITLPDPQPVEGFDDLIWTAFHDPEGNSVNLLDGA